MHRTLTYLTLKPNLQSNPQKYPKPQPILGIEDSEANSPAVQEKHDEADDQETLRSRVHP